MYKDKTVLITGGASGIGHAVAQEFARRKAHIYSFDIQPPQQKLERVAYRTVDVCNYAHLGAELRSISPLDYVVHSAGINCEPTPEGVRKMFDVNLKGSLNLFSLVTSHLVGRGQLVHIASDQARSLPADALGYATSKLAGYIAAQQLADRFPHLIVKFALPGPVDTPLFRRGKADERIKRINPQSPDYLARKILELLESDKKQLVCKDDFGIWTHELR